MSRLPNFLNNRLTDGGEVSALHAGRPLPTGRFLVSFLYRLSRTQGHSAAGRIRSIEKSSDPNGNLTRGLPAYSKVLHPTTLPRAPSLHVRQLETEEQEMKQVFVTFLHQVPKFHFVLHASYTSLPMST
jgi:hypothetical protein